MTDFRGLVLYWSMQLLMFTFLMDRVLQRLRGRCRHLRLETANAMTVTLPWTWTWPADIERSAIQIRPWADHILARAFHQLGWRL